MKRKYQMLFSVILAVAVILTSIISILRSKDIPSIEIKLVEETADKQEAGVSMEENKDPWMTKHQIQTYQNSLEDNQELPESDVEILFYGYQENFQAFNWLSFEEWERLQSELKGFLQKKGIRDVTEAYMHSDTIQKINDYEWYVYLDVNHKNVYADCLVIRVICDKYQEIMRFTFEIQYGN